MLDVGKINGTYMHYTKKRMKKTKDHQMLKTRHRRQQIFMKLLIHEQLHQSVISDTHPKPKQFSPQESQVKYTASY